MKNLLTVFALIGIATGAASGPASAQSFCSCEGTGNVLVFSNKAFMPSNGKAVLNDRALRAYASEGNGAVWANSPQAAGGGSAGYNEMLRNF
jgi:hypothetical protein